jgi:hypothetical protein
VFRAGDVIAGADLDVTERELPVISSPTDLTGWKRTNA